MSGPLQTEGPARGMIEDFEAVAGVVEHEILDVLDHRSLNDVVENPTCERIAAWIWDALVPAMPALDELVLWETATACAVLRKSDAR